MKAFKKILRPIFVILSILIIIFNLGSTINHQTSKYMSTDYWTRFPELKKAYYNSIYANKKGTWLPDEILYAFNGGALIKGESPILVNPEVPPVGKYVIGLSTILFNNEHIIILFSAIISLLLLFLLGTQVLSSKIFALIPVVLISFEPIFLNQLIYTPLLDIIHLMFLLSSLYFFNLSFRSKKHTTIFYLISNCFLGLFISTKFFATGIPLVLAFMSVLIIRKDMFRLKRFLISLPISLLILLFSYIRVLIIGYPFIKFLGIQKWVYWYNQGHIRTIFSVWPLLLFNKWYISWSNGKVLFDPQWRITWPIVTITSLSLIVFELFKKFPSKPELQTLMGWVFFYLVFLSLGDASARYFVILIPILYIIFIYGIKNIVMKIIIKYNL